MYRIRLTLQNRITTLMIIFSIIFISAFTFIQLNNQLNIMTEYNSYRARLGGLVAKITLEKAIASAKEEIPIEKILRHTVTSLISAKIAEGILLVDSRDGKILAADRDYLVQQILVSAELNNIKDALNKTSDKKWFYPRLEQRNMDLYIPIIDANGNYNLVAKVSYSLGNIKEAMAAVYKPSLITAAIVILINILLGFILSKTIIGPIKVLNRATREIAGGNLELKLVMHTDDELEELALTFNEMSESLIKMKALAENVNPLTKLPGNILIREEIERCIREGKEFVAIHSDLDNFKAFNDKYGLAKGDEAIKLTADILKEGMEKNGNPHDLLGHEGGDDFVLVTSPDKSDAVTSYIIKEFEQRIRSLYNEEDLQRGYIEAKTRQGQTAKFPIMTISLAGVSNQFRKVTSYAEVTNIATEVKSKAKSIESSIYILDKRHG